MPSPLTDDRPRRKRESLKWQAISIGGFTLLWELLARAGLLSSLYLPPPSELFRELTTSRMLEFYRAPYAQQGTELLLLNSVVATIARVTVGMAVGYAAGVILGFAIGYSRWAERLILPLVTLMAPVSPVAWIPFAMLLFGIGNAPALFVVVLSVFFLITISTVSAIHRLDRGYLIWAQQHEASRWQTLRYVLAPALLPSLFSVLRVNFFAAYMSALAAEMVGVSQGLGQIVMVGRSLFNVKLILVAMMLIGACGYSMDKLLASIERRVLRWREEAKFA